MYLDSSDYKTIWKLAHNMAGMDQETSDSQTLSPDLIQAIQRLVVAIRNQRISVRTENGVILGKNTIYNALTNYRHDKKLERCLKRNEFDQNYLDSLYVAHGEVIGWCKAEYLPLPACWSLEDSVDDKETKNYRPIEETENRIRCQAIASALWELDPAIHPQQIVKSKILRRFGNGRLYNEDTIKNWIAEVDPQKDQRKTGRPPNVKYKIDLKIDPQLKD